jgi:hypothetical protein
MARRMLLLLAIAALVLPMAASADWDPTEASKWVQYPDLTPFGIDVNASGPFILADDFLCTMTGPITDIHIWGSWLNDYVGDAAFTLSIHADIPADTLSGDSLYSRPGAVLWTRTFYPGEYVVRPWAVELYEGWMDPPEHYIFPGDHACYQYNFFIPETEAFIQHGTTTQPVIYWLDVHAQPTLAGGLFGWKTSMSHWNDDAVWGHGLEPYYGPWYELRYPPNHELYGQSIDLAFVITTLETTQLDWGDAPDSPAVPGYPTLAINGGANHVIVSTGPWLGNATDNPDGEADGQPTPAASGDDLNGTDDEDGVSIPGLVVGKAVNITYEIINAPGCVDAWIDFNGDQIWQDPAERILGTLLLLPGVYTFPVVAPIGSITRQTFARFRISSGGLLPPTGGAADGEVEDYRVDIHEQMKWIQAPDLTPTGIDVDATEPYILADDFLCTKQGRIVEIKVWGSWLNDYLPGGDPTAVDFTLSFHADVPVGPGGYSEPGAPLWVRRFLPGEFTAEIWRDGITEGWMYPPDSYWYPGDTVCWLYTFYIPATEAFFQQGTESEPIIYWLDVQAYPYDFEAYFGWKTSLDHWNDDAVWGQGPDPYFGPWRELRYPNGHEYYPQSIDLAFGLKMDPNSGAPAKDVGELGLFQNQPNPFKASTTISYEIPSTSQVRLEIFDVSGRMVSRLVDQAQPGGVYSVVWNGNDDSGRELAGGVYFYRLSTGNRELTHKMMFLK